MLHRETRGGADRLGQTAFRREVGAGETQHPRRLKDPVVAQLLEQQDGGDVARFLQGTPNRDYALAAVVPVHERMTIDLALRVVDEGRGRIAVGECGGVLVNLEG